MRKQLQLVSDAVQVAPLEFVQTPPPLLQHGTVVEHCWPANEQAAMSGGAWPAMSAGGWPAMSAGGGVGLVHVPVVEPAGMLQVRPEQQSPVLVHLPFCGTHVVPQTKCPLLSGTHGVPLQQSADDAQYPPVGTHALTV
jgi:hypothetical protein